MPEKTLQERVSHVEWTQEHQEKRLNEGAGAFSKIRQALDDMTEDIHKMSREIQASQAPQALPWRWIAAFSFTLLCAFGGGVWTLARYPDRTEFTEVQKTNQASHKAMQDSLGDLKESQDSSMSKIDSKLGRILGEGID